MAEHQKPRKSRLVKVTLQTLVAGPKGIARPGTVVSLPEDEASLYLEKRFAREYDPKKDLKAPVGLTVAETEE